MKPKDQKNNESFAELMARKDRDEDLRSKVAMTLLFLFIAPAVIALIVEALDKALF